MLSDVVPKRSEKGMKKPWNTVIPRALPVTPAGLEPATYRLEVSAVIISDALFYNVFGIVTPLPVPPACPNASK